VLVAKLITDIQVGIQAAFLQQVESISREIEMLRALPEERLAEYLVPEEEVVAEFRRLFPPAERTETLMRTSAGVQYKSAVLEIRKEEAPLIERFTGYEIKPEDVREGRITPEGEKRIIEHLRMKIAKERLEAIKEVYRRGVPYLLVDHGKITVKLAFYASPQESSQTQERSAKPASEFSAAVRPEAVPLRIEARVVNERNVEALGREAGAIGEIEISFKVDLR
jgi:DNA-binding transcriptional regulator YdaS (Cro superfamily)